MNVRMTETGVKIELSRFEKIASLHGDVEIPYAEIESVTVDPAPMQSLRGKLKLGLRVPGRRYVCTTRGRRELWAISGPGEALRLTRRGGTPAQVTVTAASAAALASEIETRKAA